MRTQAITNTFNSYIIKSQRQTFSLINYSLSGLNNSDDIADRFSFTGDKVVVNSYKPKTIEVLYTEKQIQSKIKRLAKKINEYYNGEPVTTVTVMKGALPFSVDLSKRLDMPLKMEFVQISSRGESRSSSGSIQEVNMNLPNLDGQNVLILEDIVDTGLTGKYVIDYIKSNFKTKSLKFCTFIDIVDARKNDFKPDFSAFTIKNDNRFVLGYGLDDKGYGRNWPFVGYDEESTDN